MTAFYAKKRDAMNRRPSQLPSLLADKRGSVAITFGLSIIPMLLAAGLTADYAVQQTVRTRLDSAADAAALAAIKTTQTTIATLSQTNPNPTPQAIADGIKQGGKSFMAQASRHGDALTGKPTVSVAVSGQTVAATVTYRAAVPSRFGKLVGVKSLSVVGSASAELTMPKFLDFHLLLDVSGSMGLPSTAAGQALLAKKNPDELAHYPTGCVFACHFPGVQGYTVARANNIQLRVDAVGAAVAKLMETAEATRTLPKQFRVGVYPFVTHANTFVDLTSDLSDDQYSVAKAIDYNPATGATNFGKLLDAGDDTVFAKSLNPNYKKTSTAPDDAVAMGAGGTHIQNIFNEISAKIASVGTGATALSPLPFVFFVSDGMQNSQWFTKATGVWAGVTSYPTPAGQVSSIRPMDPTQCDVLKKRGVTVAVLYVPYEPIAKPNAFFANSQDLKANAAVPNLAAAMKACASTDFFFSANSPEDIADAMQKMFAQAVQSARLTQ